MRVALALSVAALALCSGGVARSAPAGAEGVAPKPACLRQSDGAIVHRFAAADRVRLVGVSMGRGPVGVVLAHERGATLCNWLPYARVLKARGYRVLAFDFRGHGLSGTPAYPRDIRHERDVVAAAKLLRRLGAQRIVLAGASMGGTAATVAGASLRPAPTAIVMLSSPAQYIDLDAAKAAGRMDTPILLVAAQLDRTFPDEARRVYDAARSSAKQLEIVPGGVHGTRLLRTAAVRDLVTAFIVVHTRRSG